MASPNTNRNKEVQALDFYTSPIDFVKYQQKYLNPSDIIWEPSVGSGKVSKPLEELGYQVCSSDIYDYGYVNSYGKPTEVLDFFKQEKLPFMFYGEIANVIMTNPPYKGQQKYVEHALKLLATQGAGCKIIMLLRLDFLTSQARGKFFKETGQLKHVDIFSYRIKCLKDDIDDGTSSAVNYAIFVWETGYTGLPTIDWITK